MTTRMGKGLRELEMRGQDRAVFGCIVTAKNLGTGVERSFHREGPMREALAAICDILDGLDGDWRVVCISTPTSIYRDLQGSRNPAEYAEETMYGREYRKNDFSPRHRENQELSRIGRRDLIYVAPRKQAMR